MSGGRKSLYTTISWSCKTEEHHKGMQYCNQTKSSSGQCTVLQKFCRRVCLQVNYVLFQRNLLTEIIKILCYIFLKKNANAYTTLLLFRLLFRAGILSENNFQNLSLLADHSDLHFLIKILQQYISVFLMLSPKRFSPHSDPNVTHTCEP